jgi:predicted nucleotidyltransferase
MPVRRFRSVDQMNQPHWREPGDPDLYRTIARVWTFGQRTGRRRFPPGVHRHRSIEELDLQTARWNEAATGGARMHRVDKGAREALIGAISHELAASTAVSFAYVFGSFLDADGFRDLDVGVWTDDHADRNIDVELAGRLAETIGLPVDVRRINDAPLSFRVHVLRGRLLLARDELLLADVIERSARAYHDIAPMLRRAAREAFAS